MELIMSSINISPNAGWSIVINETPSSPQRSANIPGANNNPASQLRPDLSLTARQASFKTTRPQSPSQHIAPVQLSSLVNSSIITGTTSRVKIAVPRAGLFPNSHTNIVAPMNAFKDFSSYNPPTRALPDDKKSNKVETNLADGDFPDEFSLPVSGTFKAQKSKGKSNFRVSLKTLMNEVDSDID